MENEIVKEALRIIALDESEQRSTGINAQRHLEP